MVELSWIVKNRAVLLKHFSPINFACLFPECVSPDSLDPMKPKTSDRMFLWLCFVLRLITNVETTNFGFFEFPALLLGRCAFSQKTNYYFCFFFFAAQLRHCQEAEPVMSEFQLSSFNFVHFISYSPPKDPICLGNWTRHHYYFTSNFALPLLRK